MSSRYECRLEHFAPDYFSSQFSIFKVSYQNSTNLLLKCAKHHVVDLRMVRQSVFVEFTNVGIFEMTGTTAWKEL
jgi:hypothetical protein